jgi:hypothetical protein
MIKTWRGECFWFKNLILSRSVLFLAPCLQVVLRGLYFKLNSMMLIKFHIRFHLFLNALIVKEKNKSINLYYLHGIVSEGKRFYWTNIVVELKYVFSLFVNFLWCIYAPWYIEHYIIIYNVGFHFIVERIKKKKNNVLQFFSLICNLYILWKYHAVFQKFNSF